LITAAAGFLLASKHQVFFRLLIETLAGIGLVIAAACVFNNYIDRGIDKKMSRTAGRAIPAGKISGTAAILYGLVLAAAGFTVLVLFTNWLVIALGAIALFFYVVLYGVGKRRSVHGTLIGSVPGAAPPAAGYLAVTNHIDSAAIILFLALVFWQMPHFYAIAMYRINDYKRAGLPVLPVKRGLQAARIQILLYIAGFTAVAAGLTIFGYTGYIYLVSILALGLYWLVSGLGGYTDARSAQWGRKLFFISLIVNLGFSLMVAVGSRLP
jgi:heme o synthase